MINAIHAETHASLLQNFNLDLNPVRLFKITCNFLEERRSSHISACVSALSYSYSCLVEAMTRDILSDYSAVMLCGLSCTLSLRSRISSAHEKVFSYAIPTSFNGRNTEMVFSFVQIVNE